MTRQSSNPDPPDSEYRFILFVAGDEQNSRMARQNLARFCRDELRNRCEVKIIDILEDFNAAVEYNILLTPSLLILTPKPDAMIVGNLKETAALRSALSLNENRGPHDGRR